MNQQRFGSAVAPFLAEEIPSTYGYPSRYRPRPLAEQVARLQALFPGLGSRFASSMEFRLLPEGAEGYFAIPRWEKIAKTRNLALQRIFSLLTPSRPFQSYRDGERELEFLRQRDEDAQRLQRLAAGQEGQDILVVPAQLGLRHRGRSARRARLLLSPNEFGLGAYEVGVILLTHPERLIGRADLWIDCVGDEYAQDRPNPFLGIGLEFCGVPTWYAYADPPREWHDRLRANRDVPTWYAHGLEASDVMNLEFMTSWFHRCFTCAGAATGFVP